MARKPKLKFKRREWEDEGELSYFDRFGRWLGKITNKIGDEFQGESPLYPTSVKRGKKMRVATKGRRWIEYGNEYRVQPLKIRKKK